MKRITVVIPTYNAGNILSETLTALGKQSVDNSKYEVIVVDDCSEDTSYEVAKRVQMESRINMQVIRNSHNRGTYAGYNTGARMSDSELLLFLDQDCVPHNQLLEKHIESHDLAKQPVSVIGKFIWHQSMRLGPYLQYFRPIETTMLMETENINDMPLEQFITGNCSIPKETFYEIGGFDESFTYGFGDTDLGLRWKANNYKIVGNLEAIVYHYHPMSFQEQLQRKHRIGTQLPLFCQKNPDQYSKAGLSTAYDKSYMNELYNAILEYFFHFGAREQIGVATKAERKLADLILQQDWDNLSDVFSGGNNDSPEKSRF